MNQKCIHRFATALLLGVCAPLRAADPTPEQAAACVAALEVEAEGLVEQFRSGRIDVERELLQRVQQGFAFIAVAYKQGLRDEAATKLLAAAEQAQQGIAANELAARQANCRAEGTGLLERANPLERAFISRSAQRRVDKLKRATG